MVCIGSSVIREGGAFIFKKICITFVISTGAGSGGGVRPIRQHRGVEQLVARWAHNPKVAGSSPVSAT